MPRPQFSVLRWKPESGVYEGYDYRGRSVSMTPNAWFHYYELEGRWETNKEWHDGEWWTVVAQSQWTAVSNDE